MSSTESLERIHLPNRDPILPPLYWSTGHPLEPPGKKCIAIIHDTSKAAMEKIYAWERTQKVPHNKTDEELRELGKFRVPLDTIFYCRALGNTDPTEDAPQNWHYPASFMPEEAKAALRDAAKAVIGPLNAATLKAPVRKEDGTWEGGLAFERNDACKPVKPGTRCYTIANSYQAARGTWSPAAASKINGSFNESNLLRRNLNLAIAPFAMAAMTRLPSTIRTDIYDHINMLNIPSLGLPGNTAHNTMQLNVAPAVAHGSAQTLGSFLGPFGEAHNDDLDSAGRYTNMTMYSSLPDDYILSQFHIIRFGIYFVLRNFDSANFCGLNYHGGTPAIAPPGAEVANDAYRLTFISYPPEMMGDGLGHVVVGAMPTRKDPVLKMSSEMQHVDCESGDVPAFTNQANFAVDGRVVMDIRAHVTFMARMFLLLVIFLHNQLPGFYDVRIDSDRFLSAFSFTADNITRETVGPWADGPGYRPPNSGPPGSPPQDATDETASDGSTLVGQLEHRSGIKRRWRLHYNKLARHIPFAVVHDKYFEIDEMGALLHAPLPISQSVDASGNPIDAGGRPYVKPVRPMSKAKADKLLLAAERGNTGTGGKRRRSARTAGHSRDVDTEAEDTGRRRKSSRLANGKGKGKARNDTNDSEDGYSDPKGDLDPEEGHESVAVEKGALWGSNAYSEMEGIWTTECDAADQAPNALAVARLDRTLLVDVQSDSDDVDHELEFADMYIGAEIKLVSRLQYNIISQDNTAVETAYRHYQSRGQSLPHTTLRNAFDGMRTDPLSVDTCVRISGIWTEFDLMRKAEATATLELKLQRHSVMLTTFCVWSWLDSYCVQNITNALKVRVPDSWIGRLTKHVSTLMSTRVGSRDLKAADFGLNTLDTVYHYRQRVSLDVDIPDCQVVLVVLDIIACWLNFPTKSKSRAQAWFVDAMIYGANRATLFLDSVWYAFNHLETEVFGQKNTKITSPAAFDRLRESLRHSALANPSSEESLLLNGLQTILHNYRAGIAAPTITSGPSRLLLTASDSNEVRLMNQFLDALLQLEPLLDEVEYTSLSPPSRFQAAVHSNPDFLLPFREHGPSRARSRLPGHSFDPAHSRTRSGLFSGLIFRGIIFATRFSKMATTTHFADPDAWRTEAAKFSHQDADFFCNLSAYSRAKCRRGTHLVASYWDALSDELCSDWEENTHGGSYDFQKCYNFLKIGTPQRFEEIGPLIGFLLAADFSYAGAVMAPDVSTVAKIIRDINKGGMKGLEQLELIPNRPLGSKNSPKMGNVVEVKAGFSKLYSFLDLNLSEASKTRMCFDAIMVENGLCKWTRWVKMKLITLLSSSSDSCLLRR
ncbi:hypothetical protein K438DRAFT_1772224 [Mycena galopus ATCC 62051]|nr:hypothetical protein K438DRAFT_1772224 [Mycena galopus ATCC 62051]